MLEERIEKICDFHEENDTLEMYIKIMRCCMECLLVGKDLFLQEELAIIYEGCELWDKPYDPEGIKNLHLAASKFYDPISMPPKRANAFRALLSALLRYEAYDGQEHERPNALDYFVFYLHEAGMHSEKLSPIIEKHFQDILSNT